MLRLERLLRGYAANCAVLARFAHASWWKDLAAIAPLVAQSPENDVRLCSHALMSESGIGWPDLDDFSARASSIAALPLVDGQHILRMRGLIARRMMVRRCVDKERRMKLIEWVGADALEAIMTLADAPQWDRLQGVSVPELESLSDHDVAWEGLNLLRRDGEWQSRGPLALMRLIFPRGQRTPKWIAKTIDPKTGVDPRFDQRGSDALFTLLPRLYPEWPW
ncbi:hypothetical protein LJR230_002178 [Trinickia sp. LjRoot230]|uniref:type III secretion protein HrpB4 n=1 Tax=Trinickia sp. LjRoot230 TaxID=3342288 RepID=UPI003ECCE88B